jgi:GEVED domain/Beta-propeller repeat
LWIERVPILCIGLGNVGRVSGLIAPFASLVGRSYRSGIVWHPGDWIALHSVGRTVDMDDHDRHVVHFTLLGRMKTIRSLSKQIVLWVILGNSSVALAQPCALDVFVANDQSGSVSSFENIESRQFITAFFNGMQPWGTGAGESRVAIADWDSPGVWQQFNFPVAGQNYTTLLADVLAYQNAPRTLFGGTDPYTALLNAYQSIAQTPIAGRVARPVIVLMTDAACSQVPPGLGTLATQVKNAGVYVIVVAIEAASACTSLMGTNVASPGGYFSAPTYAGLVQANVQLVQNMINASCNGSVDPSYDLAITLDGFTASGCNTGSPAFTANFTVTNASPVDFNGPLVVSFYNGPPSAGTTNLLLVQNFGVQSIPGAGTFTSSLSSALFGGTNILYALVNFDGALPGHAPPVSFYLFGQTVVADEYSTFNNTSGQADRVNDPVTCPPQAIITTDIVSGGTGCNDLVTYEITICNTGDASAFITPTLPIATPGAVMVSNTVQPGTYTAGLDWATYYGGDDSDEAFSTAVDPAGNVYIAGTTKSAVGIATAGAFNTAYTNGRDAFLVKFNSNGVRQWGTYYGDDGDDYGTGVAADAAGNVYLVGHTDSPTGISTVGSHQPALNNAEDAFIVKFNTAGVRLWASYYGGAAADFGFSVATDATNNVFLAGVTEGSTTLATAGSFDNTFNGVSDQFLVKFNATGVRQWATYYGGVLEELEANVATDPTGNVYLVGQTLSVAGISTAGSAQAIYGGNLNPDAYLAKFATTGVRQWATYCGGLETEEQMSVACDPAGNAYLSGTTNSDNAIAFGALHQGFRAGGRDGFLVKYNTTGVRQWGNYIGGSDGDEARDVATDAGGFVYVTGSTTSPDLIASLYAYSTVLNGIEDDAFLIKFTPLGQRRWGTYYGGPDVEDCYSVAVTAGGTAYIAGATASLTDIATPGAHQTAFDTDIDAFLAKFFEVELPYLLSAGECIVRQYVYDYSAVAAGTYSLSMGIVADVENVGEEPPLVLPDIGFNAGTFVNIDGFNGAVHTSDNVTIPAVGTICTPGPQISLTVNIPPASSCGTGYFATATITITNNSGLNVANTDLFLNVTGAGTTYASEIYNTTAGLLISPPNVLDPNYPFVPNALYGFIGIQTIPIVQIPPGVSTFYVDIAIGTGTANLFARIDSIHSAINPTGQSNLASDVTGVTVFPYPVITGFNCPGSVVVGANIVLSGITVTGATVRFWSSTTVPSLPGTGTLAAPTLTYTPTPLDVANGFVEITLTAVNANGCETTRSCQVDIANVQYDYGDAPMVYDLNVNYQPPAAASTLFSGLYLGNTGPDFEALANNSVLADGDGLEEDALLANPYTSPYPPVGASFTLSARATNNTTSKSFLHAYIDWDADGDFLDLLESSLNTVTIPASSGSQLRLLQFTVPPSVNSGGLFYIRLRLSVDSMSVTVPYMAAPRGETEDYVWESIGPLPVEMLSFTGREEGETVRLDWSTASELNSSHYVVERSKELAVFEPIGTLAAAGFSSSILNYTHLDRDPLPGTGYYRLKQVDNDGASEYFGPIVVKRTSDEDIWIEYVSDHAIAIHGLSGEVSSVTLQDMTGRIHALYPTPTGLVDVSRLAPGVYVVSLARVNGTVESRRFLVR